MKTITVRDDIYERLVALKRAKDSFSDVIRRLLERRNTNLSQYFGILADSSAMDDVASTAEDVRKSAKVRSRCFSIHRFSSTSSEGSKRQEI
jgi:predicted CopG family antitoxin